MTLLLLSAFLAASAAAWVVLPLAERRTALIGDLAPGAVLDAEARRRVALASLKELEYDYLGGKLDEADYHAQRQHLSLAALSAIRRADAVAAGHPASGAPATDGAAREEAGTHACGFRNPEGSRFCGGCGARLA